VKPDRGGYRPVRVEKASFVDRSGESDRSYLCPDSHEACPRCRVCVLRRQPRSSLLWVPARAPLITASSTTTSTAVSQPGATQKVTTSLDGLTRIPHRIMWQGMTTLPAGDVLAVNFLIDGKKLWVEHDVPYFYAGNDNYLVTSFLPAGEHRFTVQVQTVAGLNLTDTVVAATSAGPTPPAGLVGT
jgi:hypothetical protein